MKKAAVIRGALLVLAGMVMLGAGCRSPLFGPKPVRAESGPVEAPPAPLPAAQPEPEQRLAEPVVAPESPVKKSRSWFKREKGKTAVVPEAVAEGPKTNAVPPAEGKVIAVEGTPDAAPNKPWHLFRWKSSPKAVPAVGEPVGVNPSEGDAKQAPPLVEPVSTTNDAASATTNSPARPWYKFWGGNKPSGEEPSPDAVIPEPPVVKGMFSASGDPLIKKGYNLRISVSAGGKTELEEQVKTVSDKGDITLLLIGTVVCEGKTVQELADELEKMYAQYIRDPQASVEFAFIDRPGEISPWGAVAIYGSINQSGRVNIPPTRDLTLSRAIQASGGLKADANEEKIQVTRRKADGSSTKIVIDLMSMAKRGESEKDIILEPGDIIWVPQRVF